MSRYLCLQRRCPESLWLYNSSWHDNFGIATMINDDYDMMSDKDQIEDEYYDYYRFKRSDNINKNKKINDNKKKLSKTQPVSLLAGRDPDADKELIIMVFIGTVLLSLFIYGWIILNSYATKLFCDENNIFDECIQMDCQSHEKCSNIY
ncbi:uncharacterized protein LOC126899690 [Daktulosphaira vitifoliae]|uniref:uncharacterized protein LOC126899690 n=1 Tax=Daktulosphaira vitifoliae TaxID=58002 RepID=UPI0021AA11BC|nr:uncharacterized protein LOC126899690 [Daktulosphaira vitifoliae]